MPKLALSFKGRILDVFHLQEGETLIGRDPDCGIIIDSLAVAPINVRIKSENHACYLENLDTEYPVLVNHNPETASPLNHGDVIQIGKHTLSFSEDALELGSVKPQKDSGATDDLTQDTPQTESKPLSQGMLQILNGEKFGRIIPLNRNMTRIGRTGGHCAMISRRDSGYFISYLEGPASPMVNKNPIGEAIQLLNDGDIIELGSTQLQFHI